MMKTNKGASKVGKTSDSLVTPYRLLKTRNEPLKMLFSGRVIWKIVSYAVIKAKKL